MVSEIEPYPEPTCVHIIFVLRFSPDTFLSKASLWETALNVTEGVILAKEVSSFQNTNRLPDDKSTHRSAKEINSWLIKISSP